MIWRVGIPALGGFLGGMIGWRGVLKVLTAVATWLVTWAGRIYDPWDDNESGEWRQVK